MTPPPTQPIRVGAVLPYLLVLPAGRYPSPGGLGIDLSEVEVVRGGRTQWRSRVEITVDVPVGLDAPANETIRYRRTNDLLEVANRLIRWYRVAAGNPEIVEVGRADISPVEFFDASNQPWLGLMPLEFAAASPPRQVMNVSAVIDAVRNGIAAGTDPSVADLNLLDAAHAVRSGRYREAVLHCWGAIDATFSRKYTELAKVELAGEPADTIKHLAEFEVPLKVRMSGMMHLIAGRSLARETGLWTDLTTSYDKRNGIIHRGESATESDAEKAMKVANRVVRIMGEL